MNVKEKIRIIKYSRMSKEEKVLREIFSNTKMTYLNEHILEFYYKDNFLLEYDDNHNIIIYDIDMIFSEFQYYDFVDVDEILTPNETTNIITKLMDEYFNITNVSEVKHI